MKSTMIAGCLVAGALALPAADCSWLASPVSGKQWRLQLADGGRTLMFGALRGTQVILR